MCEDKSNILGANDDIIVDVMLTSIIKQNIELLDNCKYKQFKCIYDMGYKKVKMSYVSELINRSKMFSEYKYYYIQSFLGDKVMWLMNYLI